MNSKVLLYFSILFLPLFLSGQTLLKDIDNFVPGASSSPSNWSAVSNDLFVFEAMNTIESQFLFASDGTEAGTIGLGSYLLDTDIIRLGNRVFFGGCNILLSADSCTSLYVSDGTEAGTSFFFDLDPGNVSLGIEDMAAGDSLFFFSGHTIDDGYELWRSNGTVSGTYQVADIAPGATSGYAGELAVIDDIAYFAGYTDQTGTEAWRSDGTASGTYMITDLNEGTANSQPSGFTKSGGFIYFSGLGTDTGVEVRRTNGQQENIEQVGGRSGTTDSSSPRDFVDSDGTLYYVAEGDDEAGFELFVYNHVGNPLHLDFDGDIFPRALMPFGNGEVIFNAKSDTAGRELWRSDGTIAGTKMIVDLYPGGMDGVFGTGLVNESFYVWNDSLVYFAGADGVNAVGEFVYELFVTNGTAAGTQLISDQYLGPKGTNPGNFFEFGNRLYFAASDSAIGREPYYLDFGITSIFKSNNDLLVSQLPYPNPLPNSVPLNIEIKLPIGAEIHAQLFDLKGQLIQNMQSLGYLPAGKHALQIPVNNHPAGLYNLVINGGGSRASFLIVLE